MGVKFYDQYSLLHIASGIVAYYWNISLRDWILLHSLFEYVENTSIGMQFINKYVKYWPGGKPSPDDVLNSISDIVFAVIGWIIAYIIVKLSKVKCEMNDK